jgi:hypothetical protein
MSHPVPGRSRSVRAALALIAVSLLAVLAPAADPRGAPRSDAFCWRCLTMHRLPGQWIGMWRMKSCPLCDRPCDRADEIMAQLRRTYRKLRDELADVQKKIGQHKLAGNPVPHSLSAREDYLLDPTYSPLVQLERQWDIIKQMCKKSGNIWGEGEGPIDRNPPKDDRGRQRGLAAGAAGAYKRCARDETTANDILSGFFGSALPDFKPPVASFRKDRARVANDYLLVAKVYDDTAAALGKPPESPKPDAEKTYTKPVKPVLVVVAWKEKGTRDENLAASTIEWKRNNAAYTRAYLEAVRRFLVAQAVGDKEAMAARSLEARQFAWYALKWGQQAAQNDAATAVTELKALTAALEKAAKAGNRLADLLERFQKEVKEKGLPAEYRESLQGAGASESELDAAKKRLLELTPAGVEEYLKSRQEWGNDMVKTKSEDIVNPDTPALEGNFFGALALYPEGRKAADKK